MRKRVTSLRLNASRADVEQLRCIARGMERDLDVFKAQQRQQYEAFVVAEHGIQESLEVLGRRFEAWCNEPSAVFRPLGQETNTARGCSVGNSSGSRSRPSTDEGTASAMQEFAALLFARFPDSDAAFAALDTNSTGQLSLTMFQAAAESLQFRGDARSVFSELDVSKKGILTRCDFTALSKSDHVAMEDPEMLKIRTALEALQTEIERAGGATGGWSEINHDTFMRIFRMFKMQATPAFFTRVEERFPEMPHAKIADHARWLAEHEQRQATKRKLLQRRRERKAELDKEAAAEREASTQDAEQRRQASEREHRQREDTKRRLTEWRQQRAEEEERAAAQQRQAGREQARMEREHRRQQLVQRETVEAYRRQREVERARAREGEAEANASAVAARRALSLEDRQRISRRNEDVLRRKLQLQAQAGPAPMPPGAPAPRSRGPRRAYDHVESRLYENTRCFEQKVREAAKASELLPEERSTAAFAPRPRRAASAGPAPQRSVMYIAGAS